MAFHSYQYIRGTTNVAKRYGALTASTCLVGVGRMFLNISLQHDLTKLQKLLLVPSPFY